jgi:hypothetical protein
MPQTLTTAGFIAAVQKRASVRQRSHHQVPLDKVMRLLAIDGPTGQSRLIVRILSGLSGQVEVFREAELALLGARELELVSGLIEASLQGAYTPSQLSKALQHIKIYTNWRDG